MRTRLSLLGHVGRLACDRRGATATEYAFVIAFISIVSAIGMAAMGNNLSSFFSVVGGTLGSATCEMPASASDKGKSNSNRCKDK